jgi:hypothetical protein
MAQVFISFIHEELLVAEAMQKFIQVYLKDHNGVFLSSDQWAVYAGELWFERIVDELKQAKVVVSLLSPVSVARPWVNFEAGAAWLKPDTYLIPACFGGLTKGNLPKPYSSLQALNLDDKADQYYLLKSVFHYLNRIPPPPAYLLGDETGYKELSEALVKHNQK